MALSSLSVTALLLLGDAAAQTPKRNPYPPTGNGDKILNFNETVENPAFVTETLEANWIAGDEDGFVVYESDGSLVLENYATNENETFVSSENIPADYYEYWIRSDLEKVMFATNYTQQYRHSYFADYQILDVESGETTPLIEDQAGDIQYAEFAPEGDLIAFVRANNLWIKDLSSDETTQITEDGGDNMFNAVPDWVYEEEIFGDRFALWFSPDGGFLSYLSFNETGVGTFTIPYYMNDSAVAPPYPEELELRYPKVGTTNPTVELSVLDLSSLESSRVAVDAFPADDLIIGEVAWVTDEHDAFVYRAFNRVQTMEKIVTVMVPSYESSVNRERDGSDGWLDNNLAIQYVGAVDSEAASYGSGGDSTYYIDMSDASGWAHIYLFPVNGPASENITLTSGEWEVRSILKVDGERQLVYYASTERHSTESHLYSVSFTGEKEALVDDSVAGYWSASFSSGGSYYLSNYLGPDVPYQELYSVNDTEPVRTVADNAELVAMIDNYHLPNTSFTEVGPIPSTDYMMNVMVQLPPNFDATKKYPVLFTPYGGPGAQEVTKTFKRPDWNQYITSDPELEYITYTVDNRGTGFKGRAFRATVTEQLGLLEPEDQIWAAHNLLDTCDYVDPEHVGMWGWSFGGYLTAKTLETQGAAAEPFTLGLMTAPVSDWRFYDSMYTERYMRTPETNDDGYNRTAVRDTAGFEAVKGGFSIMHGTGDDNVHYQNAAALIDLLVGAGISPYKADWRAFTDSAHSIQYNGANLYLYKYLTKYLYEEKRRTSGMVEQHQWTKREVLDLGSS